MQGFGEGPILDRKRGNLGLRGGIIEAPSNTEAVVGVRAGIKYALVHQFGHIFNRVTQPGTVWLRTNKKGDLTRQTNYPNLAVFKKKKNKLGKEVRKSFGKRYSIHIPKRKYLFFNNTLIEKLKSIAIEFLNRK
jgi:phage gpG-like protein